MLPVQTQSMLQENLFGFYFRLAKEDIKVTMAQLVSLKQISPEEETKMSVL
jgi:hypothetical protein